MMMMIATGIQQDVIVCDRSIQRRGTKGQTAHRPKSHRAKGRGYGGRHEHTCANGQARGDKENQAKEKRPSSERCYGERGTKKCAVRAATKGQAHRDKHRRPRPKTQEEGGRQGPKQKGEWRDNEKWKERRQGRNARKNGRQRGGQSGRQCTTR